MAAKQYYLSTYRHGVDAKRRVQIPAKWKPEAENTEFTLVLWEDTQSKQSYLRVLPPEQMASSMAKLEAMSTSDPVAVALRRNFAQNSDQVVVDKAGRICLPEKLASKAGIECDTEAELVGAAQWFEIWNRQRHELALAEDQKLVPEGVKKL